MTVIFILIGCSLVLALMFLGAFFWSIKTGQNDDLVTPGYRVLFDDVNKVDEVEEKK
ncbi:cbb3-type cytochrome oxidase assembly protein CcoS [Oscillatoria amoena NRMC-F 0135]|nr:cbb3-type cytochrome oxidase assembly protein CcoS [Oscillatoria amoena NRMC-F 0135]